VQKFTWFLQRTERRTFASSSEDICTVSSNKMTRTRNAIFAAMLIFSAFNHAPVNGLGRSSVMTKLRLKSNARQTSFLGSEVVSFGSPQVEESRKVVTKLRASSLSHDEDLSIDGTENAPTKSLSDRRILQLIPKVHERLLNEEYSGTLWDAICYEASAISESDHKAATLMSNFILSQSSFESAVIDFVANQLETPLVQATSIRNLFAEICMKNPELSSIWALDLMASAMRDNSQPNAVSVLLFNKGFHSLVTYRIANALWLEGRDSIAIYFQSLTSRVFGADIHPACKIGHSCSLSGATGVVIGETAVIGNYCSISHDVTLGGNGKQKGDRHPKVRLSTHVHIFAFGANLKKSEVFTSTIFSTIFSFLLPF
jgi:serine acetyltransferase